MRKPYPTDLSDDEWNYIEPHMPAAKGHGRPRIHSTREILNAIFYVLRSGCQWRMLPHDFPRWPTVYHSTSEHGVSMVSGKGSTELYPGTLEGPTAEKPSEPSAGIVDSQSVKTTGVGGEERGIE
jgi:putative transposase